MLKPFLLRLDSLRVGRSFICNSVLVKNKKLKLVSSMLNKTVMQIPVEKPFFFFSRMLRIQLQLHNVIAYYTDKWAQNSQSSEY